MIPLLIINRLRHRKSRRWVAFLSKHAARPVRIWSAEYRCWWRPGGAGYTQHIEAAGIYTFSDALDRSQHAGTEKQIFYQFTSSEPQ